MNILQFGLGKWGVNHNRILRDMGHHVVHHDIDTGHDFKQWITDRYDAVVVTTSTVNHYPIALHCLRSGIPVFVEKPFCLNREQLNEFAYEALRNTTAVFMAGHQLVFMPEIVSIKGEPKLFISQRTGAIPRDEGAIMSLAVHDIALAYQLKGNHSKAFEIDSVTGSRHDAKILMHSGDFKVDILVQSFARVRLRHSYAIMEHEGNTTISNFYPDNWNKTDLLFSELDHFCTCAINRMRPWLNNLTKAIAVMNTTIQCAEMIKD